MEFLKRFLIKETILIFFLVLAGILSIFTDVNSERLFASVDWSTVIVLTGLLFITKGLEDSGYFEQAATFLSKRVKTERGAAFVFTFFTLLTSMFLTNDIALFVIVPLTLTFFSAIENDLLKIVAIEAVAANAGSVLTPIGNPQNIFLWHKWGVSFFSFALNMLPLFSVLTVILTIAVFLSFPSKPIKPSDNSEAKEKKPALFLFSILFLIAFVFAAEFKKAHILLPFIAGFYLLFFRKTALKTDFLFIILFITVFIDMYLLYQNRFVSNAFRFLSTESSRGILIYSAVFSQFISNVPAAVYLSKFSANYKAIAYGVNIGGFGFFIGSFANLIAIRLGKDKRIFLHFHKISVPYFFIALILAVFLFT